MIIPGFADTEQKNAPLVAIDKEEIKTKTTTRNFLLIIAINYTYVLLA